MSEISPPFPHISKFGPMTLFKSEKSAKSRCNKPDRIGGGQEFHSSEHAGKHKCLGLLSTWIPLPLPLSNKPVRQPFPVVQTLAVTHEGAAFAKLKGER